MLHVVQAMELEPIGVFKDTLQAEQFNKQAGDSLTLYRLRTTLPTDDFRRLFFARTGDGYYLERCCGAGNVSLRVNKPPFQALHCVSGPTSQREKLNSLYTEFQNGNREWERNYYKESMLLSIDEVIQRAMNPFQLIFVRNFGEVNKQNIEKFKTVLINSLSKVSS